MAATRASSVRTLQLALLVLTLALAGSPPASAQVLDPAVSVTVEPTTLELGAANATNVTATVANTAPNTNGNVVVTITAPDGWTAVADTTQFALTGGATQQVVILLTAPAAATGAATGSLVVDATITETAATARSDSASASVALTRIDPVIAPPPPVPWYETTGGILAIVGAILLVAGAVVAVILVRRKNARLAAEAAAAAERAAYLDRETGITIALAEAPRQFGPRRDVVFRVAVENTSARPRVALVSLELPAGWKGAPQLPRVPLSPGEKSLVTVCVGAELSVPADARATITVIAKPEEARERDERLQLEVAAAAVRVTPKGDLHVEGSKLRANANTRPPK